MLTLPPLARYRLYSQPSHYSTLLAGLLAGKAGQQVEALEAEACRIFGSGHALATNQARVGIYLAVKALVKAGRDKVVMSPYTIFEVVNMVIVAGGKPVFADIERTTCNIDAAQVEALVDDQTAAVLVTHLHGLACDIERIAAFCRTKGVALIEDAAQAVGTKVAGRQVGTFGTVGVFSFGLMKNVNAFFGGMVLTSDADLDARMRATCADWPVVPTGKLVSRAIYSLALDIATWPLVFRSFTYWLFRYGYRHQIPLLASISRSENNPQRRDAFPAPYQLRMSDIQARLVRRQITDLDAPFRKRLATARIYHEALADIPEITLPPLKEDGSHGYLAFAIHVPQREQMVLHLFNELRDCAAQHLRNCADLDCFADFHRDCPNARAAAASVLMLPTYPRYSAAEARRTVAAVRSFFGK